MDIGGDSPVYSFENGRVRLQRPAASYQRALKSIQDSGAKTLVGFRVRNRFGNIFSIPVLQFEYLKNLFESGDLQIVDYIRSSNAQEGAGMRGADVNFASLMTGKGFS